MPGCGCGGGVPKVWQPASQAAQQRPANESADPNERIAAQHEIERPVWPASWNGGPRETANA